MSLHHASPRQRPATPSRGPARSRSGGLSPLRLVTPVASRARRAPFVVVVLTVLSAGLVGLILMSTVLQGQSFEISELRQESADLQVRQQQIGREVDALQAPSSVADRASALGMVPNPNPAFLRLSDGRVIGVPEAAEPRPSAGRAD